MQRLYVGGLSHTVTQKDLKDRFGKFGDVEDVELRIKRDSEGVPYKTFGYININISDAKLKRCFTVLNKSKWKGGTLRIEIAKESFLQRLAEERQAAAELDLKCSVAEDKGQKVLDSLREAGVENFTMKAAVPGTEVPGHEKWVVSKFGRVLPILQLSHQKGVKVRSMKYDPSKYSHNIRRLDKSGLDPATPISGLTWELQGGDSDISKKRRGEFPPFQPVAPKRSCTEKVNDRDRAETRRKPPTPDVTDSKVDEDDFEEVGLDYVMKSARTCLQGNDTDEEDEESSCYSSDSDYEALFSNVPVMKISLADLQKLNEESQQPPETAAPSSLSSPSEEEAPLKAERRVPKKGTTPEQILTSILEDFKRDELKENGTTKNACVKMRLPPFRGTRALREEEEEEEEEEEGSREAGNKIQKLDADAPQLNYRTVDETLRVQKNVEMNAESCADDDASGALQPFSDKAEENEVLTQEPVSAKDAEEASLSEEEEDGEEMDEEEEDKEEEEDDGEEEEDDSEEEEDEEEEEDDSEEEMDEEKEEEDEEEMHEDQEEKQASFQMFKPKLDEEQQKKDNIRRLAAIQQRQKVTEEHKKVIQSALAKLDSSTPGAGKHLIFDSDEEEHGKEPPAVLESLASSKREDKTPATGKDSVGSSAPQLFGGIDDEDSDEDEDTRFNIRPQFEGEAGHKLMELQSRFRTDDRFRMDARFLEDVEDKQEDKEKEGAMMEGDGALEEERKKNLSILQSVLGSSQQNCNSTTGKAKTFRDVSALHYDPTREEHAAMETKTTANKDSKSARRKKREEAEKVPEVSKEIYYDVLCDLKAAFGEKKDGTPGEEEKMNWDQNAEAQEEKLPDSFHTADAHVAPEESTGFQFSFFGDDIETGGTEAEYKVETISALKATRQPWQQGPQLNDSSSEEEEEEEVPKDDEEQFSTVAQTKDKTAGLQGEMFFFVQDDGRLTEGPRLFRCSSHLEEQKEQWEERRSTLRMEYRKKHKEARRKLKNSKKSF